MRIAKENIPVKIDVPGATARQVPDFGDATGYGKIGGEYFSSNHKLISKSYCCKNLSLIVVILELKVRIICLKLILSN